MNTKTKSILLVGGCGYIGTYLYEKLISTKHNVIICDTLIRANPLNALISYSDYRNIKQKELEKFDIVLWFGGHSSVSQSIIDPHNALSNNCIDLYNFTKKIPETTKFIYASTASLYSKKERRGEFSTERSLVEIPEQNAYDSSKFAFDYIAKNYLKNYYGLRMGTLSGYSKNLRPELVFNAMNIAAKNTGIVKLKNSESMRTILYLKDLWVFVENLINNNHSYGFYNVGSYTATLGDLAIGIAKAWGAKIQYEGDSETYSFALDCSKMKIVCGQKLITNSLEENCREFIKNYEGN